MRTRRITSIMVGDIEVDLGFNPDGFEPIISQPTEQTLIVGALLHDSDCQNPMKENDCEGTLYTYNEGVITDDRSAPSKLGLNEFLGSYYSRRGYDLNYDLDLDGIFDKVAEKVTATIKADPELTAWMVASVMECEDPMGKLVDDLVNDRLEGSRYTTYDWSSDEDQEMISRLGDYDSLAKAAWENLYAEGKIGEYLAVPVSYAASVHGPGTTQIYTTDLDSANAVWVPDKCAIENMNFDGCVTYADKLKVAEKYAEGVLEQYELWCNGDCWGIVVESFVLEGGTYERVGDADSCWGFIGQEWAEKALKEQMGYAEKRLKEAA